MKKTKVTRLLVVLLSATMLLSLAACGRKEDDKSDVDKEQEEGGDEGEETIDLSSLTFGPNNWGVPDTIDYSQSWAKRFDGLEYTRIVNTNGTDLPEGMTIDDNTLTWALEQSTGLKTKTLWSASGDAYKQKLNQAIASGEIPDLMRVDFSQYYALIKAGLIADLTDELRNGDHPTLKALYAAGGDKTLDMLEVDGRIYGIPQVQASFDGSPLIWIRKDWMDELGLDEPKCLADLEDIAKAFMAADMDGNGVDDTFGIPVTASWNCRYGGDGNLCDIFLNVGGAAPGIWQEQEDGTIIYGSLMDGAKEALTLLNSWYEQGIIPEDFATWGLDQIKQVVGEGKCGIALSPWWGVWSSLTDNVNIDTTAEWTAYMLPEKEGGEIRSVGGDPITAIFVVSAEFEEPSAFVYAYDLRNLASGYETSLEGHVEINNTYNPMHGSVWPDAYTTPISFMQEKVLETGEIATMDELEAYVKEETGKTFASNNYEGMFAGKAVYDAIEAGENPREATAEGLTEIDTYMRYLQWIVGPSALLAGNPTNVATVFQGRTESMDLYDTFLNELESTSYVNMIMGNTDGMSISDYFDEFVEDYLAQGGAEIAAEVSATLGK